MILDYKQIGKNLARRRKELKLKQAEVCERAEINDKYLFCIETARSIPSLEVFLRLCTALESTPDQILPGSVRQTEYAEDDAAVLKRFAALSRTTNALLLRSWTCSPMISRNSRPHSHYTRPHGQMGVSKKIFSRKKR